MDFLLHQIERALERKVHFLAVMGALTLPDVCAALESADGVTKPDRYKAWYDKWVLPKYPLITSQDMYMLRSGVLHQARLGPPDMQYDKIIFMIHGAMHNCISRNSGGTNESVLQLDCGRFCRDMVDNVGSWYVAMRSDVNVEKNMPHILQFRPNGLPPHFVGIPVIA